MNDRKEPVVAIEVLYDRQEPVWQQQFLYDRSQHYYYI